MMRLFNQSIGDETKLTTKLHYQADKTVKNRLKDFSSNTKFKQCHSANEVEEVYELIKREIGVMHSLTGVPFAIEIKLSGKLNGKDVTQKFKDLDSYHQFLENNALIKPSIKIEKGKP